jgi:hypothetical protein
MKKSVGKLVKLARKPGKLDGYLVQTSLDLTFSKFEFYLIFNKTGADWFLNRFFRKKLFATQP